MKIRELRIKGFRAYKDETPVVFGDLAMIVGKNDVGKSCILYALNLFFKEKVNPYDFPDKNDSGEIEIEISFNVLPEIIQMRGEDSTFAEERLIDSKGFFSVKKVFKSKGKPTIYIKALDFSDNNYNNLASRDEANLNKISEELSIDYKRSGAKITNLSKRRAISQKLEAKGIGLKEQYLIPSGDAVELLELLPDYFLFTSEDVSQKVEAASFQNNFKDLVVSTISESEAIPALEKDIKAKLSSSLQGITDKLHDYTGEIKALEARPAFTWKDSVSFGIDVVDKNDFKMDLNFRGAGIKRLVLTSYLRYISTQNSGAKQMVLGIEEPETYLHPGAQRDLLYAFREISEKGEQVFATSHSPVFVGGCSCDELILVKRESNKSVIYQDTDICDSELAKELGISVADDLLSCNFCIYVEGPDDIDFLKRVFTASHKLGKINKTLSQLKIEIMPYGGGCLKHIIERTLLKKLGIPYMVFHDSDLKSPSDLPDKKLLDLQTQTLSEGETFTFTRKREIENYLPHDGVSRITGKAVSYDDFTDMKAFWSTSGYGQSFISLMSKMTDEEVFKAGEYSEAKIQRNEFLDWWNMIEKRVISVVPV